jgi:hypothetical protein
MKRIEYSEMTNRLHRNMVGSAAIIVGIVLFHIEINKATASGFDIENLTTGVLLKILLYGHCTWSGCFSFG